jgi:hypothetical protein
MYKLLYTERIFNFWFDHSSFSGNCLPYEACFRLRFTFHISSRVPLNLYNIINSKWETPASKHNSHLLKIFFDTWRRACLEILPFSLRKLHFSRCKDVSCPTLTLLLLVSKKKKWCQDYSNLMVSEYFSVKRGRVIMWVLIAFLIRIKKLHQFNGDLS